MKNFIEEFYKAVWCGGAKGYPSHVIFCMPSKHGKSLTTYRFSDIKQEILINPSDTTAESYRRKITDLFGRGSLAALELIILEDWTKVRKQVQEPTAAEMIKFASGVYSLDQFNVQIKPTKVSCSTLINNTPFKMRELSEINNQKGAGGRFDIYEFELSNELKEELDFLGFANQKKPLTPIVLPDITDEINYNDFGRQFKDKYGTYHEINLAYGCEYLEKNFKFFDAIKRLQRTRVIKEISWEGYWEEEEQ